MTMPASIEDIRAFAQSWPARSESGVPDSVLAASAFGWAEGNARVDGHWQLGGGLEVSRGFVGPQRAVLFGTTQAAGNPDTMDAAALFAYHASIEWGVLLGNEGAVVFNSHWVRNDNW